MVSALGKTGTLLVEADVPAVVLVVVVKLPYAFSAQTWLNEPKDYLPLISCLVGWSIGGLDSTQHPCWTV